jgi:hypothetical protein
MTRDALERRLTRHAATAAQHCPTLHHKKITAHVMRHTAAMRLLAAGVDSTVIALWLGHENLSTTRVYIHADLPLKELALKEQALARTAPPHATPRHATAPTIPSWPGSTASSAMPTSWCREPFRHNGSRHHVGITARSA